MIIHRRYENLNLIHPIVTVGVFDGVHLGHRALLDHVASVAQRTSGESIVVTFNPHPRLVLSNNTEELSFLSTMDEKKKLLAESPVDHLIIMDFTNALSNMEAGVFIRDILLKKIGLKHLVVGYDNHFGKSKEGDFQKIAQYAALYGFTSERAGWVSAPEGIISSTTIREALLNGHLEDANRLLGYDYSLTGTVIEGRKLGRSFGFPTANIKPSDNYKLIPANGVYAVTVCIGKKQMPGMLSIGFNPTVTRVKGTRSIEVNIFDLNMDLYNQTVKIIFRFRLRDEKKFENVEQLAEQMKLDKQKAMRLLD